MVLGDKEIGKAHSKFSEEESEVTLFSNTFQAGGQPKRQDRS